MAPSASMGRSPKMSTKGGIVPSCYRTRFGSKRGRCVLLALARHLDRPLRPEGNSPMRKRVYKFTSAQYGISNLEKKRLKLSTIEDLNDPFDLCPLDTTDPVVSQAADAVSAHFRKETAILCFSRNWDNLLL